VTKRWPRGRANGNEQSIIRQLTLRSRVDGLLCSVNRHKRVMVNNCIHVVGKR
jgi:hypothetical protein